jgi:hypothetical protein
VRRLLALLPNRVACGLRQRNRLPRPSSAPQHRASPLAPAVQAPLRTDPLEAVAKTVAGVGGHHRSGQCPSAVRRSGPHRWRRCRDGWVHKGPSGGRVMRTQVEPRGARSMDTDRPIPGHSSSAVADGRRWPRRWVVVVSGRLAWAPSDRYQCWSAPLRVRPEARDFGVGALVRYPRPVPAAGTSTRSSTDRASDYGSEGWEFESLRVRQQNPHHSCSLVTSGRMKTLVRAPGSQAPRRAPQA